MTNFLLTCFHNSFGHGYSLEDKDPKTEFGFSPKIIQKHSKPGSLEGQGPKSKISKINFTSWIRGFCRHLYTFVSSFFLKDQDQDPKTESRFSPKIMQIRCKPAGLEDQDSKTESGFSPKIMQIHCKQGGLEDKDPKTEFGFSPKIIQNTQNQVVWRVRVRKVRFPKLILHRGLEVFVDVCIHVFHPFF